MHSHTFITFIETSFYTVSYICISNSLRTLDNLETEDPRVLGSGLAPVYLSLNLLGWRDYECLFDWISLSCGSVWVPNCSVIGPVLLKLYFNDLPFMLESNSWMHADDLRIWMEMRIHEDVGPFRVSWIPSIRVQFADSCLIHSRIQGWIHGCEARAQNPRVVSFEVVQS